MLVVLVLLRQVRRLSLEYAVWPCDFFRVQAAGCFDFTFPHSGWEGSSACACACAGALGVPLVGVVWLLGNRSVHMRCFMCVLSTQGSDVWEGGCHVGLFLLGFGWS